MKNLQNNENFDPYTWLNCNGINFERILRHNDNTDDNRFSWKSKCQQDHGSWRWNFEARNYLDIKISCSQSIAVDSVRLGMDDGLQDHQSSLPLVCSDIVSRVMWKKTWSSFPHYIFLILKIELYQQ